jgi:hypothetical protein
MKMNFILFICTIAQMSMCYSCTTAAQSVSKNQDLLFRMCAKNDLVFYDLNSNLQSRTANSGELL